MLDKKKKKQFILKVNTFLKISKDKVFYFFQLMWGKLFGNCYIFQYGNIQWDIFIYFFGRVNIFIYIDWESDDVQKERFY